MEKYPWKILRYGWMENKSRSVNYLEIAKLDVLEAQDYVDRVPDVNLFFSPKGRLFSRALRKI